MATKIENEEVNYAYDVEISKIMDLIINNVYSNKDVFLREAISNASDALSKILESRNKLIEDGYKDIVRISDMKVEVIPDKKNKKLIIRDNGIGMTKGDLIEFLGKVASSGTSKLKNELAASNSPSDKNTLNNLIGKFGVGLYSLFLVADDISVVTKHPMDAAYEWKSRGKSGYSISKYPDQSISHGTCIELQIKDEESKYLESQNLIKIAQQDSREVIFPVYIQQEVTKEVPVENDAVKEVDENNNDVKIEEVTDGEEKKTEKKTFNEMKLITSKSKVWNKDIKDVTKEELQEYYKSLSKDYEEYGYVQTFFIEGNVDVRIMIFIPKKAKMNFFEKPTDQAENVRVYDSNVFITNKLDREVVPAWMDFVTAAVVSSDFSLNISREFLQGKNALKILKNKLPQCIAEMFETMKNSDKELFEKLVLEFNKPLKMAVRESKESLQKRFVKLLRYPTHKNPKELIGLDEYCSRIGENEKQILYLTGLNSNEVSESHYLDSFTDRHVLLMSDVTDEIMLQAFKSYNGLNLQSIAAEGVEHVVEVEPEEFEAFDDYVMVILCEKVEKVVVSKST